MLSRASVPLVIAVCAFLVGGVSLFVNFAYDQDQVAADESVRQGALAMLADLEQVASPTAGPLTASQVAEFTTKFRGEQAKPLAERSPVRWSDYEFLYAADHHLLLGRPKFYGRGYWLTVAVLHDPTTHRLHLYVNDAGGRWGVDLSTLELGPDWHEWQPASR